MRKIFLAFFIILSAISLQARNIYNINKGWKFSYSAFMNKAYQDINIPHTWNSQVMGENDKLTYSLGNYIKQIKVPKEWMDKKRVFVRFGGASNVANLFVNGKYVGEHRGGYTAFTFEITPFIMYDSYNSLMLIVSNTPQLDVMPIMGDLNNYGGIYRDVELIVTDINHISLSDYGSEGVYIKQKKVDSSLAEIDVLVKLSGMPSTDMEVEMMVYKDSTVMASGFGKTKLSADGNSLLSVPISIFNPRLWNGVKDPFLYDLKIYAKDEAGASLDSITVPFGVRTYSIDRDKGFILNGEPYNIRGVNKYQDKSGLGIALSRRDHEDDINIIMDMGATAVRMTFAPQDRYVYDLCDRKGLIVWSDIPFVSDNMFGGKGFIDSYLFKENGERQLREMIRQNYNHPSVVFWGLFSDISTIGDSPISYIQKLNDIAHAESPDRFTASSSIEDGSINFITDVIGWSQYFGVEKGSLNDVGTWINQFKTGWREIYPAISEYGAVANIRQQPGDSKYTEAFQNSVHEAYLKAISNAPFFWGSFVNSMFDYGSENRREAGLHGVSGMGLVSYDRNTKKDAYYLYKANWNDLEPFLYITSRRNVVRDVRKQNIKVYTNIDDPVTLYVNGKEVSRVVAKDGIVEWSDVMFNIGKNIIRVSSGRYSDTVEIEVFDSLLAQ